MIVVGEKINTSRKRISSAVKRRDAETIVSIARAQAEAGADYIDVNAGTFLEEEVECLCWLVETVQGAVDRPLCLDSPNPEAIKAAIKLHRGVPLVNSISLERERFDSLFPLVSTQPCRVVALCMAETSMPTTADDRVDVGRELITRLEGGGVRREDIFVDLLVQPVSVDVRMGKATLEAISRITDEYQGINTICGLSNISFGLPERRLINRSFLARCIAHGLTAAIVDPTDSDLMSTIVTVEMLLGQDEYCERFIEAHAQVGFD